MIESGLYELVTGNAAINKFLAGPTACYFSFMAKQTPVPAVVIHRIASSPVSVTLDAPTADFNEMMQGRFQLDSFGQDNNSNKLPSPSGYLCAAALSRAIRCQLKAMVNTALPDGTLLNNCIINDEFDADFEIGGTGYIYRRVLDLTLWFQETA